MSVINGERNQKGVQVLGTDFQSTVAAGHGVMLYHTNGRIYSVFARNFLNGVQQRRLYISYSSDGGNNWATPAQLTSGNWDDNPCGLQLDTTSTSSDIGIVFTRTAAPDAVNDQILYRIAVNQSTLALTTPVDPITGSPTEFKFPSLVKVSGGYAVFAISSAYTSSSAVSMWTNAVFADNTWSLTTISNFWGSSTLNPFSLSVKRLGNGHLGAISCVRTSLNGSTTAGVGNLPRAIVRTDAYVSFSADDGATWSAPQNLTNYSGSPDLDLSGLTTAFDADFVQLSDSSIVVVYQEGHTPQYLDTNTNLALPPSSGNVTCAVYHPGKNYLIVGTDDATNGGVFVFDLTAQTRTRIFASSTPAIWGNSIQDLALSFDNKYLAVAHTIGLEIIDTTNSSIASWTVTPIRTTTTPASRVASMRYCRFDSSGYLLYVAYGVQSVSNVCGFIVDASSPTTLTDLTTNAGAVANVHFIINSSGIISLPVGGWIEQVNKTTGAVTFSTNFGGTSSWVALAWDDVNSESVVAGSNGVITGIHRITVVGSTFTVQQSFGPSSNPAVPTNIDAAGFTAVPGSGIYYQEGASGAVSEGFYSFGQQQPLGFIAYARFDQALGENEFNNTFTAFRILKSNTWRFSSNGGAAQFIDLKNSGRLRYAFFPYDATNKQLLTSGVDFYDMTNTARVGNASTGLQKVRIAVDNTDVIYAYVRKVDLTTTRNQYAAINGHVEPDAFKLFMRARILRHPTQTLQSRARIRVSHTHTLQAKALIVFAQCLKVRAHIVPRTSRSITLRARIKGNKSTVVTNTYQVAGTRTATILMTLFTGRGYALTNTLGMGARIAKMQTIRCTHHLIVYNNQSGPLNFQFSTTAKTAQNLAMRANISRP